MPRIPMKRMFRLFCLIWLTTNLAPAKTKLLVDSPENVVVGRYAITGNQRRAATEEAESLIESTSLEHRQKARVIRYVIVSVQPLTQNQARKEPRFRAKAERRFARYDLDFDQDQSPCSVALYDTANHRVMHSRLYTLSELPKLYEVVRVDDYQVMYLGGLSNGFKK